jgi:hypothetical protein
MFDWFTPANPLGACVGESCPLCAPLFAAHRARLQREQHHREEAEVIAESHPLDRHEERHESRDLNLYSYS